MIEVIGTAWNPKATYDIDGRWDVDDAGVLWIRGEENDRGLRKIVATHASGTWSSVVKVEKVKA